MKANTMINKMAFKAHKRSPEILLVFGVVGVVASTVMACRATKKAQKAISRFKERQEEIQAEKDESELKWEEPYDEKAEIRKNAISTGCELVKAYAPAAMVGVISLGCIFQSHRILKGRNLALAAAYNSLDASFKKYKEKVAAKLGEEAEKRISAGTVEKAIDIVETDEDGKEKKVKKKVEVIGEETLDYAFSPYARLFAKGYTDKWDDDADYNKFFLDETQRYANDYLVIHGYLFLNQVYEWLGFKKTLAGQQVGWIYDPKNNDKGDNHVDFGIREVYRRATAGGLAEGRFINGYEPSVWLDFNVDGEIMTEAFDREI